jgi:tetratricopeptide (TPR) repeat protein
MLKLKLILILLFVLCFSFATYLQPRQEAREHTESGSSSVLTLLLGDGRRMFADQIFAKADAYFHRGNYPSIFDLNARSEENHMAGEKEHHDEDHAGHDEQEEGPPPPRDFVEAFGRHFYPTVHVHLKQGEEREMLPWLRFSAELDPHRVESYTVAAYWLRERLGKVDEAEEFLRDGLRANPNDPAILNELGSLYFHNRHDSVKAENIWKAALRRWQQLEGGKNEPDTPLLREILGGLSKIEKQKGNWKGAVEYLTQLKKVSPDPEGIQKQIDDLSARAGVQPSP